MTTAEISAGWVNVSLESWEYEWAAHVGVQRLTANRHKRDAAHYDPARMQDNLRANVAACCCEIAVAKVTNRYWSGSAWKAGQHDTFKRAVADVGHNIEVKRVREHGKPVAVRQRDVIGHMVLFGAHAHDPEFLSVTVYGWLPADVAWQLGKPSAYDASGTRLVEISRLKPVPQ